MCLKSKALTDARVERSGSEMLTNREERLRVAGIGVDFKPRDFRGRSECR